MDRESYRPEGYDLQQEVGPKNQYDQTASEALLVGREFRDTRLEAIGTQLASLIHTIPYDSDQFFKVLALTNDLEKDIARLKETGFRIVESITDAADTSEKPWQYILERYKTGYRIILDKWYGATSELDHQAASAESTLRKHLDTVVHVENLKVYKNKRKVGPFLYEDTKYVWQGSSWKDWQDRKLSQFHRHANGAIGRREIYIFPDGAAGEDATVQTTWQQCKKLAVQPQPAPTPLDHWEYPTGGHEAITIPSTARKLDEAEMNNQLVELFELPAALVPLKAYPEDDQPESADEALKDRYGFEPRFYCLGVAGKVTTMLFANAEISALNQIEPMLRTVLQSTSKVWIGANAFTKIPTVYDENSRWVFIPITVDTIDELSRSEKSPGRSGTHYQVREMNVFVNELCGGTKVESFADDDTLDDATYLDIRLGSDGRLYIDTDVQKVTADIEASLHAIGVETLDKWPVNSSENWFMQQLSLLLGKQFDLNDASLHHRTASTISTILSQSLRGGTPQKWYQDQHSESFPIKIDLVEYYRNRSYNEKRPEGDYLFDAVKTYDHYQGIPVAGILVRNADDSRYEPGAIQIRLSGDHPHAQKYIGREDTVLARLDGLLQLQQPTEPPQRERDAAFDVVYRPLLVTDLQGMPLDKEHDITVRQALESIQQKTAGYRLAMDLAALDQTSLTGPADQAETGQVQDE